tara:strand:+ start:462 stop:674 length:213 start_codon:yes stop_codon:yes gene_type:complete
VSSQFKIEQPSRPSQSSRTLDEQNNVKRPNIDNLLKKINEERKKERRSSLAMLIMAILSISFVSYLFTQS